ncbi:PAN2-PAN3 deadenylation complex catalytic subunit PAN2-like isoform X2 [Babylonia areolata]|uniref:PAN2-PAN3 deadenylation complex catalytic subunit PAN2-like isoform X2 n=1 Tax=Babylonia areolata TaxID=304850 RepID=UPI003FD2B172
MNFPGVGGAPHFHGGGGVHQGHDMMMEQGMMGQVGGHDGFHDGQNMGHVYPPNVVQEMDYRLLHFRQVSVNHAPISSVCFDTQELLWVGTHQGHVSSYYGSQCHKHTAYHASPRGDPQPEIRQLLTVDEGVLALTSTRLRVNRRTGQTTCRVEDSDMHNMLCMIQTAPDTVLLGGQQSKLIEFNTHRGQIVNKYEVEEAGCSIFRHSGKFLCGGDTSGKVTLYDPATMRKEHVLEPGGVLADFDVQRNLIVTCGVTKRANSHMYSRTSADRLLMVYDMRVMRAMAPIQVNIDPMFLRFVPSLSHHLVVVSQMGRFQLTETATMTTPSMMIFPIEARGAISSFDLSKSCQAMAFGDASGCVHLFSNNQNVVFSGLDVPTVFADHVDPLPHEMHLADDLCSLATLPMEYPENDTLFSDWPVSLMRKVYRKPKPLDPEIVRSAKVVHNVGYASNPRRVRRNQIPYTLPKENGAKRQLSVPESPIGRGDDPFKTVPKEYQRMLMRYTKLDDFDFRHYNKTNFAGLTAEHNNSYCNGMLQVLYFVEPLRAALLSHVCQREFCLACELGFLFHMLDTKKGEACQAKNFLRAFRTLSEAAALGLLLTESEEVKGQANLLTLIPSWHRFLIQQINSETCLHLDKSSDNTTSSSKEAGTPTPEPAPAAEPAVEKKPEPSSNTSSSSRKKRKNKRGKKKEDSKVEPEPEPTEKEGEEGSGEDSVRTQEEQQEDSAKLCFRVVMEVSIVKDLFFVSTNFALICRCGRENVKDEQTKITILSYPPPPHPSSGEGFSKVTFAEVLHHSLTSESPMQTWCNDCGRYTQHIKRRQVTSLPDVLAVDCNLSSENNLNFWRHQIKILKQEKVESDSSSSENNTSPAKSRTHCRYGTACRRTDCRYWHGTEGNSAGDGGDRGGALNDPSWIPLGLRLRLLGTGDLTVDEVSDEEPLPEDEAVRRELYEVYAVVYVIEQQDAGRHLVSCIKVSEPYHQRKERVTCTQWYLFNDFCIQPIDKPEYVSMDLSWKIPSVVYYTRRTYLKHHRSNVSNWCQLDILYNDPALVNRDNFRMTYLPLQQEEVLNKGDLVGLDAEFISLKEEEAELRSDGTKSTIKPSHVSPARITCIRGQGEHFGQPFIDDYILTPEQVTDYLTEFSGIEPSELDPATSTRHLTTLKSTYQKLRCLLDIGVTFVGHGLKKDFKVINLQVPKEQIVDTVQLFHQPNKRYISLRFLAWFFLEKNIQSGQHDSAEDARIALMLYQRYCQLRAEGPDVLKTSIMELYETGRKMAWKVPDMPVSDAEPWNVPDPSDPAMWAGAPEYEYEEDQLQGFYEG